MQGQCASSDHGRIDGDSMRRPTYTMMWRDYELMSGYIGNKPWLCGNTVNTNNHHVFVMNPNTGEWTRFDYWESNDRRIINSDSQLLEALRCWLSDALYGSMEYLEFCDEFGYDAGHISSKNTWRACVRAYKSVQRVMPDVWDSIAEVLDELNEEES